jgi:hypothetical protein
MIERDAAIDARLAEETEALAAENATFAGAKYLGDVAVFRADVVLMFQNLDLGEGARFAHFVLDSEMEGTVLTEPPTEVLVMLQSVFVGHGDLAQRRPHVRMFKSECFSTEKRHEYFTTDVCVDAYAYSQYMVDSFPLVEKDEGVELSEGNTKSVVPFFHVSEEGNLGFADNYAIFTRIQGLQDSRKPTSERVRPFGHFTQLIDRTAALAVAQDMLKLVKDKEPNAAKSI